MCWCVDVLMCWCVDVLMCWCVDVLMCWCVDVLMCWCADVLMCWCITDSLHIKNPYRKSRELQTSAPSTKWHRKEIRVLAMNAIVTQISYILWNSDSIVSNSRQLQHQTITTSLPRDNLQPMLLIFPRIKWGNMHYYCFTDKQTPLALQKRTMHTCRGL